MKLIRFVATLAVLTFLGVTMATPRVASAPEVFTYPAEFEPQSALWLGAVLKQNGQDDLPVLVQMVKALAPHVKLYLVSPDVAQQERLKTAFRKTGMSERRIEMRSSVQAPRAGTAISAPFS